MQFDRSDFKVIQGNSTKMDAEAKISSGEMAANNLNDMSFKFTLFSNRNRKPFNQLQSG